METIKTDFLVVGSGIAGLSFALNVARMLPQRRVTIIAKADPKEGNTRYAQGGVAMSVKSLFDAPEKHVQDTLKAGDGLCNKAVVRMVVKEGPKQLKMLMAQGVQFDRNTNGTFDLVMEGGHSAKRVYHRGDYTGLEIERKLLAEARKTKNIQIVRNAFACDLITNNEVPGKDTLKRNRCYGAYVMFPAKKKIVAYLAPITLLATGGIGQIYKHTTNSLIATGDGIGMAFRAKAEIRHMAFVQFHPTALYDSSASRRFLITEALRGHGAVLRNADGELFMKHYHPAADLATRDVVARAIKFELQQSHSDCVYLDCRHLSKKDLAKQFPTVLARCASMGIDVSEALIPVAPCAHYSCGGIVTNTQGRTSVNNLYACGECAETGLHGANRLASNSLLEALVFAHRAAEDAVSRFSKQTMPQRWRLRDMVYQVSALPLERIVHELKATMTEHAEIISSDDGLKKALAVISTLREQLQEQSPTRVDERYVTVRNMLQTAQLVLEGMSSQKKNVGVVYNIDRDFNNLIRLSDKRLVKQQMLSEFA